ncbi:MAG: hypothetical protein ACK5NK_07605 [Niabella sp.]
MKNKNYRRKFRAAGAKSAADIVLRTNGVLDLYGDILVKDTLGNLIIYPLGSNDDSTRLGLPDTLLKASQDNYFRFSTHLFWNDYENGLITCPTAGIDGN